MFRLTTNDENQWSLLDENEETVFVGTLSECEDWLDQMENVQRRTNKKKWRLHRAFRRLMSFFSRKTHSSTKSVSSTNPDDASDRSNLIQSKSWVDTCEVQ